eukprot:INCI16255.11.p2 GENE.INCI16255.11~~INCI16255.11.p2  ORF type:complete len:195 (+),score=35.97 INCI16255.11:344-928(+)
MSSAKPSQPDAESVSVDNSRIANEKDRATPEESVFKRAATHKCAVCLQKEAKYRCPGCQMRTCSLACSKQHKVDTGCNGKRKIDEFVDIREFNVNHLMSDYTYLEDVKRQLKVAHRVASQGKVHLQESAGGNAKRSRQQNKSAALQPVPASATGASSKRLRVLLQQARSRKIDLLFMSKGMARHEVGSFARTVH